MNSDLVYLSEAERTKDFTPAQHHLEDCYSRQLAADEAYKQYSETNTPESILERNILRLNSINAWIARLRAITLARKPVLEDVLWIMCRADYKSDIKSTMNISQSSRACKHLQALMKNVENHDGLNQLAYFSSKGNLLAVKKLLNCRSINVNAKDVNLNTALHLASIHHPEVCKALLLKGANVNAVNADKETPLQYLCDNFSQLLLNPSNSQDCSRIQNDGFECLKILLDFGAFINEKDIRGRSALHKASWNNNIQFISYLVDSGADLEARTDNGDTPYILSVISRSFLAQTELKRRNADIEAVDNDGHTAAQKRDRMDRIGSRSIIMSRFLVQSSLSYLFSNNHEFDFQQAFQDAIRDEEHEQEEDEEDEAEVKNGNDNEEQQEREVEGEEIENE